jgi:YebC/PmpR family DNA-binding regulatory protein
VSDPAIGVLALQGDTREHLAALREAGATVSTVRRRAELEAVDALVIPGGESTTISLLLREFELLEPLRRRMSGHSKWATTKHKKAAIDAKRGKLFAKLIKNIEVAAQAPGGGDPAGNPTLWDAIQKAKKSSVPNDNIDRAVKRGSGAEAGGSDWQNITYEGYAPGGVAVLIECLTDNRNRAAAEVRTALTRNGGNLADPGSVSLRVRPQGRRHRAQDRRRTEDDLLEIVLDAGAEEVNDNGDSFEIVSEATDFVSVRTAVQEAGSTTTRPRPRGCRTCRCRSTSTGPRR